MNLISVLKAHFFQCWFILHKKGMRCINTFLILICAVGSPMPFWSAS